MRAFVHVPKVMPDATAVRELARAADVIEKVRRGVASTNKPVRMGCEKTRKMLNGLIVEMLKEERDA